MSQEAWVVVAVLGGILAAVTLAGAVVLAVRVWRTRKMLGALGMGGKVAFYGALAYTILPVDLLPDPIYLDDMGILAGALIYLTRLVAKQRAERRQAPAASSSTAALTPSVPGSHGALLPRAGEQGPGRRERG